MVATTDDEILACETELRQSQLNGDVATLDRLLNDVLVFTSLDGTLATKEDDLAMHRSRILDIRRLDPTDYHVLHLGETSVVSVRMEAEALIAGVPNQATLRYTRVWHRRPNGWRLVAGHLNAVGQRA